MQIPWITGDEIGFWADNLRLINYSEIITLLMPLINLTAVSINKIKIQNRHDQPRQLAQKISADS